MPAALRRLGALEGPAAAAAVAAATPPLASATRHPPVRAAGAPPLEGSSLLVSPEGDASRVAAAPELLPAPYAQRLQLSAAALGGMGVEGDEAGSEGVPTVVAAASGVVTSAGDPEAGDGMEHLTQQVCVCAAAAGCCAALCSTFGQLLRASVT